MYYFCDNDLFVFFLFYLFTRKKSVKKKRKKKKLKKKSRKRKKMKKRKAYKYKWLVILSHNVVIVSSYVFVLCVSVSYWHLCGYSRISGYLGILWEFGAEGGQEDKVSGS